MRWTRSSENVSRIFIIPFNTVTLNFHIRLQTMVKWFWPNYGIVPVSFAFLTSSFTAKYNKEFSSHTQGEAPGEQSVCLYFAWLACTPQAEIGSVPQDSSLSCSRRINAGSQFFFLKASDDMFYHRGKELFTSSSTQINRTILLYKQINYTKFA